MLVEELLERLNEMDSDAEVRFAHQPNYPLESTVGSCIQIDPTELPRREIDEIEAIVQSSVDEGEIEVGDIQENIDILMEQARTDDGARRSDDQFEGQMVVYISEDQQLGYLNSKAVEDLGWE